MLASIKRIVFLNGSIGLRLLALIVPLGLAVSAPAALAQCPLPPGDANCSGVVDVTDIAPFVLALTDPAAYEVQHPACDLEDLDLNSDTAVNGADIQAFTAALLSPGGGPTITYLTQDRLVEGLVRAWDDNSDITVVDDDTAPDFGPFINSVNLFQDSATSGGYSDDFQRSYLCPTEIQAYGEMVVQAIVAPGGFSGRAACYGATNFQTSFQLTQGSSITLTGFLDALDTDVFTNLYLTGPEGTVHQLEAEENFIIINFSTFLVPGTYTLTIECSGEVFNLTPSTSDGRFGEYDVTLRLVP